VIVVVVIHSIGNGTIGEGKRNIIKARTKNAYIFWFSEMVHCRGSGGGSGSGGGRIIWFYGVEVVATLVLLLLLHMHGENRKSDFFFGGGGAQLSVYCKSKLKKISPPSSGALNLSTAVALV